MKKTTLVFMLLAILVVSCLVLTACQLLTDDQHTCDFVVARTIPSTCTQKGTIWRICLTCGEDSYEYTDALGHNRIKHDAKAPTCTQVGWNAYEACSRCDYGSTYRSIPATGHSIESVVIEPTCTEQGYTTHTCSTCGYSYVNTYVQSYGGHNFQESDVCSGCEQNIEDVAFSSYNMSKTADDSLRGYVVPRLDGEYDVYIKGTGAMKDYSYNNTPFTNDGYSVKSAYIGNGVTSIGSYAFYYCRSLTDINIADSITAIGSSAFYNTAYYNNGANWQNKVLYIGNYLIEAKDTIDSCEVKEGTRVIADYAFDSSNLTDITIPNSVITIGERAFYYCTGLISIDISDSVTSIGERAFYNCTGLISIDIPDSVTSIGEWAFYGCSSLTSVTFEDPQGWYVTRTEGATSGTNLTLTNTSTNATYLKSTYYYYYWYKNN